MNSNSEILAIPNPAVQLFSGTHLEAAGFLCTDLETIQQLDSRKQEFQNNVNATRIIAYLDPQLVLCKPGRATGFHGPRVGPGHGLARSGYPGPIR